MRILGVDPGLRTTGYGVIDAAGGRFVLVEGGVLQPQTRLPLDQRLAQLHAAMSDVVRATNPDCMVVEELWSAPKHPPTAVLMGHARGVIALVAGRGAIGFEELSHVTVKRALTGNGAAPKAQVKAMVCARLNLTVSPEPDDVSDALALALVYGMRALGNSVISRALGESCRGRMVSARSRATGVGAVQPAAQRR